MNDSGDLNLGPGSTFAVALNGLTPGTGYSQLTVSGTVTLGGATLSATALPMSAGNNPFMIIDNTGTSAVSGTFAGLPQGAELTISNEPYQISYTGGDGNDVVLTSLVNSTTTVTPSATSITYGDPDLAHGERDVGGFELHASPDGERSVLQRNGLARLGTDRQHGRRHAG